MHEPLFGNVNQDIMEKFTTIMYMIVYLNDILGSEKSTIWICTRMRYETLVKIYICGLSHVRNNLYLLLFTNI